MGSIVLDPDTVTLITVAATVAATTGVTPETTGLGECGFHVQGNTKIYVRCATCRDRADTLSYDERPRY
jgi:outer membrane lipopolysaccharide assembly protein LptE/RlpB